MIGCSGLVLIPPFEITGYLKLKRSFSFLIIMCSVSLVSALSMDRAGCRYKTWRVPRNSPAALP